MLNCIVVGIGGFIGSVCRYLIGLLPIYESTAFPIKTFLINIVGAFIIGLIVFSAHENKFVDPKVILLLKVGVCGGFTTFSTFAEETFELIQKGSFTVALIYIFSSVILGVGAVIAAKSIVS